jgi:hypothetical protein
VANVPPTAEPARIDTEIQLAAFLAPVTGRFFGFAGACVAALAIAGPRLHPLARGHGLTLSTPIVAGRVLSRRSHIGHFGLEALTDSRFEPHHGKNPVHGLVGGIRS